MADTPIGLAVKAAREHMMLSKNELAKLSGVTRQYVYKVESGRTNPKIKTLEAISAGMGMELWRIIRYAHKLRKGVA